MALNNFLTWIDKAARLIIRLLLGFDLIHLYLTNSTNLQILRRQCCLASSSHNQSSLGSFFFVCQIRSEKANRETVTLSRYGLSHQSITKHLYYMYNFGKSQEITRFFWEKKVMKVGIWRSHSSFPHKVTLIVFFFKRRGWPIDHRGWCALVFYCFAAGVVRIWQHDIKKSL